MPDTDEKTYQKVVFFITVAGPDPVWTLGSGSLEPDLIYLIFLPSTIEREILNATTKDHKEIDKSKLTF